MIEGKGSIGLILATSATARTWARSARDRLAEALFQIVVGKGQGALDAIAVLKLYGAKEHL